MSDQKFPYSKQEQKKFKLMQKHHCPLDFHCLSTVIIWEIFINGRCWIQISLVILLLLDKGGVASDGPAVE